MYLRVWSYNSNFFKIYRICIESQEKLYPCKTYGFRIISLYCGTNKQLLLTSIPCFCLATTFSWVRYKMLRRGRFRLNTWKVELLCRPREKVALEKMKWASISFYLFISLHENLTQDSRCWDEIARNMNSTCRFFFNATLKKNIFLKFYGKTQILL